MNTLTSPFGRTAPILWLLALAVLAASCTGPDPDQVLASARKHIRRGETNAAIIELKGLLQREAESGDARQLLGQALLASGDAPGAQAELQRALEAGQPAAQTLPVLAQALLQQRKTTEVIALGAPDSLDDATAAADLATLQAQAHQVMGHVQEAQALIAGALRRQPEHVGAQVMQIRLMAEGGDGVTAVARAKELSGRYPKDAQALLLTADALAASDDDAAAAGYEQALKADPKLEAAHTALIAQALRKRDFDKAKARVRAMAQALPTLGMTAYMDALVAYSAGDLARARERTQQLLRAKEPLPVVLMLAGYTESRLGALVQADALLTRALAAMPDHAELRFEAAAVTVRLGEPGLALRKLQPLLVPQQKDPSVWLAAARAHSLLGDFKAADLALARAKALKPQDTKTRLELARSQLARGNADAGLRELQTLAEGPEDQAAQALLDVVPILVQRQDWAGALAATQRLIGLQPQQAQPEVLRGQVLQARGQRAPAREAYEAALKKDPGYLLAVQRLAELDLADGQPAAARLRFEALLKRQPDSVPALLALAEITRGEGGAASQVRGWLDKAVAARPLEAHTWLGALQLEQRLGQTTGWLALAQRAAAALPADSDIQSELGRAMLASGDTQQALRTLRHAADLRPQSVAPRLLLADAHASVGDLASARKAVDQAVALAPQAWDVERANAVLMLREGQTHGALRVVQARRKRQPRELDSVLLEADVRAVKGQSAPALALLREALVLSPSSFVAVRVSDALRRDSASSAAAFDDDWLRKHPKDATFIGHLAQQAAQRGDNAAAVSHYRKAIEITPDAALALNNLAGLLLASQPAEALALAQRAARLMPSSAAVLDTLAQAQGVNGQLEQALKSQARAVELDPQAASLRLTLARLQIRAGEKDKARQELLRLADRGDRITEQAEVRKLLALVDR